MTWFLKSKITQQRRRLERISKQLLINSNKYDVLVQEYRNENSFLNPNQQPQQPIIVEIITHLCMATGLISQNQIPEPKTQEQIQQTQVTPSVASTQQGEANGQGVKKNYWTDEKKQAWHRKMELQKEKKRLAKEMKEQKDAEGIEE